MAMLHKTTISQAGFFAAAFAISMPMGAHAAGNTTSQNVSQAEFASFRTAAVWSGMRAKIKRWRCLPDDWDGDDGVAPDSQVADAATAFVDALEACGAKTPVATVAGDGEIAYEWANGDDFASASFTADGHFIGYIRSGLNPAFRVDERIAIGTTKAFLTRIATFA